MKKNLTAALYKKALGYTAKEVVEEYNGSEGELIKRKVSKKHIPPDISALKTYLELNKQDSELAGYDDQQLQEIKLRLLSQLSSEKEEK